MENSLKLNIENDSISEKEFLKMFVSWMDSNGLIDNDATGDETFESFLSNFHKTYYEVEFVRKPKNDVTSNGVTIEDTAKGLANSVKPME